MKKILIMIMACAMFITGCSNNSAYNSYMEQGKSAVVENEYEKSKEYFALAMEEKKDDKEAKSLHDQINYLIKAIQFEKDGKIEEAILSCEKISSLESESDVVKKVSEKLKKKFDEEIKESKEKIKKIDEKITQAKDMIKDKAYSKAKESLEQILEECENDKSLKDKISEIKDLIKECDEKIKENNEKTKENDSTKLQSNTSTSQSNTSNKVYCGSCGRYVKPENYDSELNKCNGCIIKRDLSSSMMNADCDSCGALGTVSMMNGICGICNVKVSPAVRDILEDGTVIFEDGTRL